RFVTPPPAVIDKVGVHGPVLTSEDLAQALKQPIVVRANRHISIRAANGLIRRVHPVRRAQGGWYAGARKVLRPLPDRERHARLDERRVDVLPFSSPDTIVKRGEVTGKG